MATAHPQISGLADWSPLARGGFSTVWTARQITLDRLVAVKVDQRTLDEEKEQRRFLREAGAAGRLSGHPGIVTVHDAGILPDDRPYMVMELCPGGSLTKWLKPGQRPTQEKVRDVGVRIADALAAAHARGVLHRDVKPANILVDSYDNPGLADFGLAAIPDAGMDLSVTMEALTPAYAPREVFYQQPPTEYGDVYSLCATLYAFLDGKPPRWPEEGTPSLPEILDLQRQPVPPLAHVNPDLMDAILAGLSDHAEDRPTAAELRDTLAAVRFTSPAGTRSEPSSFVAATGPTVEPDPTQERTGDHRRPRRIRAAFVVVALVVLAVLAGSAVTWFRTNATPPPVTGATTLEPTAPPSSSPSVSASPTESSSPSPSSSPSGTPTPAPEGFSRCAGKLGANNYCVTSNECWIEYLSVNDAAANATPVGCSTSHVHQTFAAARLDFLQRQSQYEANAQLQKLCSRETLRKVLANPAELQLDWTIEILPTQMFLRDNLVRCLVGTGESRTSPLRFVAAR